MRRAHWANVGFVKLTTSACLLCGCFLLASFSASAQTSTIYWISMRSYVDGTPLTFVPAATASSDQQPAAIIACDGNTYYLSQTDYTTVQAALAGQLTVQLNSGPDGSTSDTSAIVCLIQAAP
jgi:hypothetical protein